MALTHDGRQLNFASPLGKDFLLLKAYRGQEGLSQLFRYELELVHEETPDQNKIPTVVDPKKILGQAVTFSIEQRDLTIRYYSGIVSQFSQLQRDDRFTYYRATVVPQIWLLTQIKQSRIFQHISVPDILKKIFQGFDVTYEIQGTFEQRNYCVQYRESDFDFASRLMEEEGIYYYFEFTSDKHRLIVANTPQSHHDCPSKSEISFSLEMEREDDFKSAIETWLVEHNLQSGKYTLWDHNFELPDNKLNAQQPSRFTVANNQQLEIYDFPGGYARRFDGIDKGGGEQPAKLQKVFEDKQRTTEIRMQEIDAAYKRISGTSDCASLTGGHRFTLIKHPIPENNGKHILVSVTCQGKQSPAYDTGEEVSNGYSNSFVCMPHGAGHTPYRPPRNTPKPTVKGSQTATVVGPAGEEIFTDKYGRVKVQFHWDRHGQADPGSSCWMRVARDIAGKNWGSVFIPRIGQEVIVDFLEGDPDQPIITGSVYNPDEMPPYKLPDEKTKTVLFKSLSTKGGGGFNEFRVEDKKGSEQIFIHGEKNLDTRIKNDSMEYIGNDRHLIVKKDQIEKVEGDKHLQVKGDQNEKIDGTISLKVGQDVQEKVGKNYAVDAGMEIHLKSGMTLTLETGTNLTLKVGGNFININPGGIFIKGTMVMINSGGAAGSGSGANPDPPKEPKEADKADPGAVSTSPPKPTPPKPVTFSPAAMALIKAAKSGAPFCEICSRS